MKKINIEIAITSYATGKFSYWTIESLESYKEAVKEFNEKFNQHDGDYEIQFIDSNIDNLKDENLYNFLKILETYKEDPDIIATLLNYYSVNDIEKILEEHLYYVSSFDNEVDAIQEYILEHSIDEIPEHLIDRIDWNSYYRDYDCSGYLFKKIKKNYIIVYPF